MKKAKTKTRMAAAESAKAVPYSRAQVEEDVKTAMVRIKGMDRNKIKPTDTFKQWQFSKIDARGLAPTLITLWVEKSLKTDPRLYNYETEDVDRTVRQLATHIHGSRKFLPYP